MLIAPYIALLMHTYFLAATAEQIFYAVSTSSYFKNFLDLLWQQIFCKQDPLRGGRDELLEDIISVIHAGDAVALAKDATAPQARRLVPEWQLKLAHRISPFWENRQNI